MLFVLYIVLILTLLLLGQWIAFALGSVGLIGLFLLGNQQLLSSIGSVAWNSINSFELTAVPLFLFMGEIILQSGVSNRFYRGASCWMGRLPGGLLQSNIFACSVFAAISGSSVATAAAIGSVATPELIKRGYDRPMVFGSLAAGGTLGILIPPSIPMIVYGAMVEESVSKLFMAGLIPGLITALMYMSYIAIRCIINPGLTPSSVEKYTWTQRGRALVDMSFFFVLIVVILGGIYFGIMTPTEAAAIGTALALIISKINRGLSKSSLVNAMLKAIKTTCMVLFIVIGTQMLSYMLVRTGINRSLTEWVAGMDLQPAVFLVVVVIIYMVLGCLMEGLSMIFLTLPVLWPIVQAMGFDPIAFGVILVILIELGQITPPVGMNLFVIKGVSEGHPLSEVIAGAWPYFFILLATVVILAMFPGLALWLPSKM